MAVAPSCQRVINIVQECEVAQKKKCIPKGSEQAASTGARLQAKLEATPRPVFQLK